MFKRIMLTLSFLAAFGVAGIGASSSADARHWHHHRGYYYGPRVTYYGGYYRPYRTYYYGPRYYGNPGYYSNYYYGYPDYYYYGPGSGVSFSIGF
jgi:hypothetical protein